MKKQKRTMKETKKVKRHIGIDLHSDCFTACFLQEGSEMETCTLLLKDGLDRFIEMLRPDDEIAVEATGNSRWFRAQVRDHVARVVVVAPGQFEVIRRSVKKTDKNDAKAIAFFLSKGMLPEARVKSKPHAELADAISMHDQMTQQKVKYINRAYAMFNSHGIKIKKTGLSSKVGFERAVNGREWSELEQCALDIIAVQLESIRKHLKVLDAKITTAAEKLPGYENLISIKGIGPLSAASFLVAIGDIRDFPKPGNLAAYFGITPRVNQSNDSKLVGRITKRGNRAVCTRLVQCALIAVKYSPYLRSFYESIKSRRGSRARPLSLLRGSFSTRSSTRSQMAGCSRIFPISNLKLATNHRSEHCCAPSL